MFWFYTLTVWLHVAVAIFGMGPVFALPLVLRQIKAQPGGAMAIMSVMGAVSTLPRLGGMTMLGSGVLLVLVHGWQLFLKPWIAASTLLTTAAILVGMKLLGPAAGRLAGQLRSGQATSPAAAAATAQMELAMRINLSLLVLITLLMVFKP